MARVTTVPVQRDATYAPSLGWVLSLLPLLASHTNSTTSTSQLFVQHRSATAQMIIENLPTLAMCGQSYTLLWSNQQHTSSASYAVHEGGGEAEAL